MNTNREMNRTFKMTIVALFAALSAVGAFIKIPMPPVPFTLQFLFCALSGIILGAKLGFYSQALYVAIGLLGVPIFTGGGGLGYIFKPTFGYLIGFIFASLVIGLILQRCKRINPLNILIASLIGLFVVYLFGVPYLAFMGKMPLKTALTYGLYPFLIGDCVKALILAIISPAIISSLKSSGYNFYKTKA